MARNFDADMDPFGGYETPSRSNSSRSNSSRAAPAPVSSSGYRGYSQPLDSFFSSSNEDSGDPTPVMSVPGRSTAGTSGSGGTSGGGGNSGFFSRPSSKSRMIRMTLLVS